MATETVNVVGPSNAIALAADTLMKFFFSSGDGAAVVEAGNGGEWTRARDENGDLIHVPRFGEYSNVFKGGYSYRVNLLSQIVPNAEVTMTSIDPV